MPTFGSLLVIIGGSLLYTRLYGGAGESEDSPNGRHEKGRLKDALFQLINTVPVARELAPAGPRSGPNISNRERSN
jgi:hypothetical protein